MVLPHSFLISPIESLYLTHSIHTRVNSVVPTNGNITLKSRSGTTINDGYTSLGPAFNGMCEGTPA